MDIEHILRTLNSHGVDYLLIGGMNFLLNHRGPTTYDIDIFIDDTPANRRELNFALQELHSEWGATADQWTRVPDDPHWLERQAVFCLTCPHGAIDVFRAVKGLEDGFGACKARAEMRLMKGDDLYYSLSDADMLRCQEALPENEQKKERIQTLKNAIERRNAHA